MAHIHGLYDFTVSAFVLHPTEPKLCLLFHKKLHKWLQPGGHVELHEDPLQALDHELREETGLVLQDCEIIEPAKQPNVRGSKTLPLPFHFNIHPYDEVHQHIDLEYIVRANTDTLHPEEGESTQIGWFNLEQIFELHSKNQVHDSTLDISTWVLQHHTA